MVNALGSALILLGVNILAGTVAHFGFDRILFGQALQGAAQAVYCRSIWVALLLSAHLFFSVLMSFNAADEAQKARRNFYLFWAGIGVWFLWGIAFHGLALKGVVNADAGAFFLFANAAAGALAQKFGIGAVNCWESSTLPRSLDEVEAKLKS
jgi:hypothetical protein